MKHILLIAALNLLIVLTSQSQSQSAGRATELNLYLTGGMRALSPKYFDRENNISPNAVPTAGAGAQWLVGKLLLGGEFEFNDGKKHTTEFGTIITGFTFSLIGGYQWKLGTKTKLGIQTGFGYNLNHLSMTDKTYDGVTSLNTAIYHNFLYSIPATVTLQRVNANGTFAGIRAGYHFNAMPSQWRYIEGSATQTFISGTDGFHVQLVFGGLLKLKQSRS